MDHSQRLADGTESTPAAAAREALDALEEARVIGRIGTSPIGSYSYQKRLKHGRFIACEILVFPPEGKRQQRIWPEKGKRQIRWLSPVDAAAAVQEDVLWFRSQCPDLNPHVS
ncbi:MAG TPA: hypothetical protein VIY51_07185 [Xanthobacteraceae bacterium]